MTNLINERQNLIFGNNLFIQCGFFRNHEVQITKSFSSNTCKLEVETDIKGFFRVAFSGSEKEVFDYYLETYGCCYSR